MDELERIAALPRRQPLTQAQVRRLSSLLCHGDGLLRPHQAQALVDLKRCRGLFGALPVGTGKTLITLLAPTVMGAKRPVLLLPASLIKKTRREYAEYVRDGWRCRLPELVSYQLIANPKRRGLLEEKRPDLLLADEAHRLRSMTSTTSSRVGRYVRQFRPVFAPMSGTLITDQLLDYWHLLVFALGEGAPVTRVYADAQEWAEEDWAKDEIEINGEPLHKWVLGTRGVVTAKGSECSASLEIAQWRLPLSEKLRELIEWVQASKLRPDYEPLGEWELPKELGRLALGFYHVWDPMPPDWWLKPRRRYAKYVTAVLDLRHPDYDSEALIRWGLDAGRNVPEAKAGRKALEAWRKVKDEFVPNPKAIWVDKDPIRRLAKRAKREGAIVWVRNTAAGEALEACGVPYYPGGSNPEKAKPRTAIACEISAHATGKNLQAWDRMIVAQLPAKAGLWEQVLGRVHRAGQKSDAVRVDVLANLDYHRRVLDRVRDKAAEIAEKSGFDQKLGVATWL